MCHTIRHVIVALVLSLAAFGSVPAVYAQDANARTAARTLAQEGAQLYEKDDFQGALSKFQQAYDKFPSPKLFWNISQALRGLSRNAEALETLERFLAEAKDANPEYQTQATAQVAQLNAKLGRVMIDCDQPGAIVSVDGKEMGTIPLAKPIILDPGEHQMSVAWQGRGNSVRFTAAAGQILSQNIRFHEKALPLGATVASPDSELLQPAQGQSAEPSTWRKHTWYWVAGGAILAAAATTLILVYTSSDKYPNADIGTLPIGDRR
jgi:tetratricopeptide (TPR) repeat protein